MFERAIFIPEKRPVVVGGATLRVVSHFTPAGDQPEAIQGLTKGLEDGERDQVLLGVTGSGKTFTMANVIERVQRPTLVLAHNKTLAAQLATELKEFLPNNDNDWRIIMINKKFAWVLIRYN